MPGLALLLLATAAPAPLPDAAYLADCATYATPLVCSCIADQLQQSNDGRLMLELTTAQAASPTRSEAENTAAVQDIRTRYGIAPGTALGPLLDTAMTRAAAVCDPQSK